MSDLTFPIHEVYYGITSGCNVTCKMCSVKSRYKHKSDFHVSMELFQEHFGPALPYLGATAVRLQASGGDPLTHPDYVRMVEYLLPHIRMIRLVTNGCALESIASVFSEKFSITLSLEGLRETHERCVVSADWDQIWRGVRAARKAGAMLQLNCCLLTDSAHDVLGLAKLAAREGFIGFRLIKPAPSADGVNWGLPSEDPAAALRIVEVVRAACKGRITFHDSVTPYMKTERYRCYPTLRVFGRGVQCAHAFHSVTYGLLGFSRCFPWPGFAVLGGDELNILSAHNAPARQVLRRRLGSGDLDDICLECLTAAGEHGFTIQCKGPHPSQDILPSETDHEIIRRGKCRPRFCLHEDDKTARAIATVSARVGFYKSHGIDLRQARVLDFGCGPVPFYALAFGTLARHVDAVDPRSDKRMLDVEHIAASLLNSIDSTMAAVRGASFSRATLSRVHYYDKIPDGRLYDFIWCNGTLEHVDNPLKTIRSLVEHLTPGGAMWLSWAPWWSWQGAHLGGRDTEWRHLLMDAADFTAWVEERHGKEVAGYWSADRAMEWGHINRISLAEVAEAFQQAGLETLTHVSKTWREDELQEHESRERLLFIADKSDLTCEYDNWLFRKPS